MATDNVEIVRRGFDAFQRGDLEAMDAVTTPELISHRAPPQPDPGTWHGRDGLLEMFATWIEGFDNFQMEAVEWRELDDTRVLGQLHQTAVGRESRVPIEADFWLVYTLADERIIRVAVYPSEQAALEATS
jgi:ketosteroid isomerase-like protein